MNDGLRRLIVGTDIALLYAPQIDAVSMRVVGMEVLVQLRRGWGEPIRLSRCVIGGGSLIEALVEWTMETACLHMVDWVKVAGPLSLTVNIPPQCFCGTELVERVLARSGLPAARLEIEVPARSYRIFGHAVTDGFSKTGVSLSLEHSGDEDLAGFDLKPFNRVKVRWGAQSASTGRAAAESRKAGRAVIADGISSRPQLFAAAGAGCGVMQGRYFCPPLAARHVGTYLRWTKQGCDPVDANRRAG